jgi:N-acetylglucosamine kinase-like BadF-type ATPase
MEWRAAPNFGKGRGGKGEIMKKAELERTILSGLRKCKAKADAQFIPAYLAGRVWALAQGGDRVAQEIFRECCRIVERPDWLEEAGLK